MRITRKFVGSTSVAALSIAVAGVLASPVASRADERLTVPPSGAASTVGKPLSDSEQRLVVQRSLDFLRRKGGSARLAAGASGLVPAPAQRSLDVTVQRFAETYRGLPVVGSGVVVRLRDGVPYGATRSAGGALEVDTAPSAAPSRSQAFAVTRASISELQRVRLVDRGLAVVPQGAGILVRRVTVTGVDPEARLPVQREVFVAKGRSAPVLAYNTIHPFAESADPDGPVATTADGYNGSNLQLDVYRRSGNFYLEDRSRHAPILTYRSDADAASFPLDLEDAELVSTPSLPFPAGVSDSGAIDAQWAAGKVLDYYQQRFNRDALDGAGSTVKSYVGLTFLGEPMANAAWTGKEMIYGAGDAEYKPFSASLDIVGHEMTHGVIEHTANLLYYGQSGAVNEAFADYFGNAVGDDVKGTLASDPTYSLMGEDICRTLPPVECAKFDLSRRATVSSYFQGEDDEQGVHRNSPIISTALWGIRLALGPDVADRLAYVALTQYLTPSSDFLAVRDAMVAAARDQGLSQADVDQVAASFARNGIVRGWDTVRAEPGARVARQGLAYPGSMLDFRNGTLVSTDMRNERTVVVAGSGAGLQGHVLPRLTSDVVGDIATDGKQVIVLGGNVDGFHQTSMVRASSVTGGKVRTLAKITDPAREVVKVAISPQAYVWQTRFYGPKGTTESLVVQPRRGRRVTLSAGRGQFGSWSLEGRRLVFADKGSTRLRSFDIATGARRTLWQGGSKGRFKQRVRLVAQAGRRIVVVANLRRGPATSLFSIDSAGKRRRSMIAETGPRATAISRLDASRTSVTIQVANLSVLQLPVAGRRSRPVSCQPLRFAWSQGSGTRVAWVDQQYGRSVILVRARPRRGC